MTQLKITSAQLASDKIKTRFPSFKPKIGIVLGSGLGSFAAQLEDAISIPYHELPGFPIPTVEGHGGHLVMGTIAGVNVVCLQGRSHSYEGPNHDIVKTYVRTLKLLGCDYFLATNASGSLQEEMGPGELMMVTDHINLQPGNPLIGPNDDEFGPRFYPLDDAYDHQLRAILRRSQKKLVQKPIIELHNIVVDCTKRVVLFAGEALELTNTEFNILEMLIKSPNQAFSKEELTEYALGRKYTAYDRSIDVHISNLRNKLGGDQSGEKIIKTVRGFGYLFQGE